MAEIVTRDRLSELTVLGRLAERAGEAETAEALLEGALDDVLSLFDDDVALALLVDDDERVLRLAAERHVPAAVATALTTHAPRLDQGVLGEAFASGRLTIVDRRADDVRVVGPELFGLGVNRLLVLPLRGAGRSVGLIVLGGFGTAAVPGERLPFLEVIGGQLGAFVDAVRLRGGQRASVAAFERLTAVAGQVVRLQDAGQLLSLIVEEAGRMLNADAVGIRKVEGDELVLIAQMNGGRGLAFRPRIKIGESLTGRIARDGQPIAVYDIAVDDRPLRDHAERALAAGFRSFLGVPFVSGGQVTGTLSIYTRERRRFSETEVRLLSAFAEQAAVAIENAKLYEARDLRAARLRTLAEVNRVISSSLDPGVVLPAIGAAARDLMQAGLVAFWLADESRRTLTLGACTADDRVGAGYPSRPVAFGAGGVGWVADRRAPINVPDVFADERMIAQEWWRAAGLRSMLAVPVMLDDRLLAVLALCGDRPFVLDADEQELLQGFVTQAAVALRNARLFAASEKRRRIAEALADISQTQVDSPDHEAVARRIVESVAALLGTRMALLYRLEPDSGDLVYLAGVGQPTELNLRLPRGTGAVGRAVAQREPVYTADLLAEPDIVFTPAARAVLERSSYRAVLAVPLIVHGHVIGALAARDERGRIFDEDDARLLHAFAGQAAVALENARLFTESERRRQAAEEIAEIGRILSSSLDPEVVAERIVDSVSRVLRVEMPTLYRHDPVSGELTVAAGDSGGTSRRVAFPSGVGVVGHALADREPFTSADVLADPRLEVTPEFRAHVEKHGRSAALAVPLITGGEVIGVLLVRDWAGRVFSEEEIGLARAFAAQAAVALKNAEMLHEARTRQARLETLLDVNRQLAVIQPLEVVLRGIAAHCGRLLDAESAGFRLVEGDELILSATWGDSLEVRLTPRLKVGESLSGIVAATGRPLHVADVGQDPRCLPEHREASQALGHRGWLGVPLKVCEKVVGVLSVRTRRADGFSDTDAQVATAFAAQAAVAVENARLFRRAEERAERLAALSSVTSLMLSAGDSREVYAAVARAATTLLGGRLTRVWICDAEADVLRLAETYATDPAYTSPGLEMTTTPMRQGVLGSVMETLEPQYIPEILDDPRFINRPLATAGGFHSVAAIPLVTGGRGLGALMTFFGERREFSDEDKGLMRLLAGQAAIAIEKSQLYEALRLKNEHLQELFDIARQATMSLRPSDLVPALVKAAAGLVGQDAASIRLLDRTGTILQAVADHGLSERFSRRGDIRVNEGAAGVVVAEGQPLVMEDVSNDPRYLHSEAALAEGIRSLAIVPMRSRERAIGTLCTYSRTPRRYSAADIELLARFADVAAVAIENARLYEDAQTRAARMKRLGELSHLVNSSLDLQEVLDLVTETARDLVKADLARLWVLDEKRGMIRLAARSGAAGQAEVGMAGEIWAGQGIAGWVIEHKRTYYSANVVEDPLWIEKDWARQAGFVSALVTPLIVGDRAIGNLTITTKAARQFSPDEQEMLELFAAKAATALENARLYADLRAQTTALEAKNAELDSFVYVVSHDLKSPLVAIQGMASMIEADHADHLDERGRRYLKRIAANVDQMERLIGDLLALSRIGREGRAAEPIAVNEVVDEVLLELAERIRSRGVKVSCAALGSVVAVRTQMVQIWTNLVSNAVKYLGDTPAPSVEIGGADRGDAMEYWVRDNGVGIDPAYHVQVFEMFQRLKDVEAEGSGVGLAIVRKIIEAAGGRVWLESAKGQGATFYFTWPKARTP